MKKRFLSLLCVLALCLGLLPTTALAAAEGAPATLYVGNQNVRDGENTTYWTTDVSGTLTQSDESAPWNVKYDPSTATLTLNEATIQGRGQIGLVEPQDYGIYAAPTGDQSVSLTINLIGSNTVKGHCGIYVGASGGDSTLVIQSDGNVSKGSLEAIGSGWDGITISSNSGNVSLTINNASVKASTESNNYHGVCIIGRDASNPILSLTVNGGSLTAKGGSGIFYYLESSANPSTSLMVSDGALIKAIPNIRVYGASKPTPQGSGIVFDGNSGTVYGDVTLDEPLTVGKGETLTIPEGSTLDTNGNLTNNGTLVIQTGGQLNGTPTGSGTVITAPTITTESPLPEGTVGTEYNQSLAAENNPTSWSVTNGALPNGLTLENGTISGTPTAAGTSTFTVKAENTAGSDSKELTLTINPAPVLVNSVTLNKSELALYTGGSATLTATVQPEDATNKAVNWSSSDEAVATVDTNGKVTAKAAGEATITATAADGSNISATCTVKVTDPVYNMTTDTANLDFGEAYTGYDRPTAKTVTITNTGNQTLNLNQPASTNSFEVGTLSDAPLAPGEKATFTVQPKAGLAAGVYREEIQVSGSGNVTLSIPVSFSVQAAAAPQVTPAPAATPAPSDNITYYTCPSCGYHNWTATDAGYRCDNCGYLESTRQLSGYGNVKGTYTPGSGATSTAVSTVPQTGDESNPVLWTVLLLVSGLALGGLAIAKRKKQQ